MIWENLQNLTVVTAGWVAGVPVGYWCNKKIYLEQICSCFSLRYEWYYLCLKLDSNTKGAHWQKEGFSPLFFNIHSFHNCTFQKDSKSTKGKKSKWYSSAFSGGPYGMGSFDEAPAKRLSGRWLFCLCVDSYIYYVHDAIFLQRLLSTHTQLVLLLDLLASVRKLSCSFEFLLLFFNNITVQGAVHIFRNIWKAPNRYKNRLEGDDIYFKIDTHSNFAL